MGLDFFISISCLIGAIVMGVRLAVYNLKMREETHEERMRVYRHYKKIKNRRLARQLGIELPEDREVSP
jgi:hypothetical protein